MTFILQLNLAHCRIILNDKQRTDFMKALILAAGFGSRLAPLTDSIPKTLVPINGKPIIFKQIENLIDNGIDDITVMAGYKFNKLKSALNENHPAVKVVNCPLYSETNNMFTAFSARKYFENADFIMMNGDVFFDSSVIGALLRFPYKNAISVDIGNYIEESMKVTVKDGFIRSISKNIDKKDAFGVSIDVYKFARGGARSSSPNAPTI